MIAELNARMFLAEGRLALKNPFSQNFTTYFPERNVQSDYSKFGGFSSLSDDRLKGGISLLSEVEEDTSILIIPYVGDLLLTSSQGTKRLTEGVLHTRTYTKGELYELRNPHQDKEINFFQIRFACGSFQPLELFPIQKEIIPDSLKPILRSGNLSISLGQYEGRKKGEYTLKKASNGLFVFVIEGAFECDDRLIQQRDGLALWNVQHIKFEALSNGAVLLIVEFEFSG